MNPLAASCQDYLPRLVFAVLSVCFVTGCEHTGLMKTPNLYVASGEDPFQNLPESRKSVSVDLLYGTDRLPAEEPDMRQGAGIQYGHGRSKSLAFGRATVALGEHVTWEELHEASLARRRSRRLVPFLETTEESGRFPPSQDNWREQDGLLIRDPEVSEHSQQASEQLVALAAGMLADSDRQEAFIFIHGYNNQFHHAALTMAQIWHFMGRPGLPVIYSWPAGRGGIRGYTSDSESSEFTVYHLKQFLQTLARTPGLEKIHILAHSRGTDVAATAIRELMLGYRAAGQNTRNELKLGNLVLAAPDLDVEIVEQSLIAEGMIGVPERFTIYNSRGDRALLISTWMMDSVKRLGNLALDTLGLDAPDDIISAPLLTFIDADVESDITGHAYFWTNPAASSDLILLLRDNLDPGVDNGRPLIRRSNNYWVLHDKYLMGSSEIDKGALSENQASPASIP